MSQSVKDVVTAIGNEMLQRSEVVEPWHSYWYHRPLRKFPPESIRYPTEYDGGDRLSLTCTQTDLPGKQQRELVREWCKVLPTLSKVRILWFQSKVTQELFDAACTMEKLEGLYIKWSDIKNLEPIKGLVNLIHLHIGGAPSAAPIDALCELRNLVDLEVHNVKAAENLKFLERMPQLRSLDLAGDGNSLKSLRINSLAPIRSLTNLKKLGISTATVIDESLEPIADLPRLKYLLISNQFEMEEFAKLAGKCPSVECDCFNPVGEPANWTQCKKCGQRTMVLLTGKRKSWLCTCCDVQRIEKHVVEFTRIAREASNAAL